VLEPGGRCLLSAFLLDDESRAAVVAGRASRSFPERIGDVFVTTRAVPEEAVACDRDLLLRWIDERGFDVTAIRPGAWCGRDFAASYQDLVALRRR
jgi:hypothetical protein